MAIRNLLLMSVALVSLAACSSDEDAAVDTSMAGMNAGQLAGTDMGNGTAAPVNGVTPGTQQDLVVNVGDRVFFGYDQSDISAEGKATLDRQAAWLKQYPNVSVTIEGHADERGTREYNLALGERRAASTKSYLLSQGIEASRIQTISYGKERPAVTDASPSGWAQNRRTVTVVN
ncbi:MAG: peptidoglycan-associated lipoprotein Pal [Alphaproteobacteria bacterium]|jgi:peptidoglycan-associated lipoprotein|nr:peptidoglycan-associated lipoprotein Pal [Alphaproteobacteria bacterium]